MSTGLSIILSILFLSITGILMFFIIFHYQLQKAFQLPHVDCERHPRDFKLNWNEHILNVKDQKKLQLWEIPGAQSNLVFLGISGWNRAVDALLPVATRLTGFGSVYLLNTRNHCKSSNSSFLSIVSFKKDMLEAYKYIKQHHPGKRLVLVGHGYAAAVALYAHDEIPEADGLILSSVFPDLEEVVRQRFIDNKVPAAFLDNMTRFVEFRAGERFERVAPKKMLHRIKTPVILYGKKDDLQILPDNPYIFKADGKFLDGAFWQQEESVKPLIKFIRHIREHALNLQKTA